MEKEDKITEFHNTYGSPSRRDQIPEYRVPDENGILKNPGIEDWDRPEDESPDPPGEVRSNAVYEDRFSEGSMPVRQSHTCGGTHTMAYMIF